MFYQFLYPFHEHFQLFNVFKYITFRTLAALLTSMSLYFLFGKRLIDFLARLQLGQFIREEGPQSHQAKKGTPTMGGVLILGAGVISTLLWGNLTNSLVWLCLWVLLSFGLIGFYDDFRKVTKKRNLGLKGRYKILFQFLFSGVAGYFLLLHADYPRELFVPFIKEIHPNLGWFYIAFIILVVVGASNAVNLTDGLDGLASVPTIIAFATYAIFAYIAGSTKIATYLQVPSVIGAGEVAVFCGAVIGAVIGFLWYNAYPAEIFMGDVGSLSLGAALGFVSVITKNEILLIMVGGIFVLETLSVITQVISFKLTGKRIFRMAPIHHHFELKGWAEPKVIVRFWIISLILAILSLSTLKLR
ncbi:MAG: phospho-N-acetylmuramoyl-pentapeptide-transferase [bacterium]